MDYTLLNNPSEVSLDFIVCIITSSYSRIYVAKPRRPNVWHVVHSAVLVCPSLHKQMQARTVLMTHMN